jgi:AGZA family xanthine/uracil permease-like MFS transporter
MFKRTPILNNTTVRREIVAGFTSFFTSSYIIFVNPTILGQTGMDTGAVFVATCLVAAMGCFLMGLLSNFPVILAPSMAVNVYFSYTIVAYFGFSWQAALGATFISGLVFFIITLTQIKHALLKSLPSGIATGIIIGIGLFIARIALQNINITPSFLNHNGISALYTQPQIQLFLIGLAAILLLYRLRIRGAILYGLLIITILALCLGLSTFTAIISSPPSIKPTFMQLNFHSLLTSQGIMVIFSLLLIIIFDSTGTLLGVLTHNHLLNTTKQKEKISLALSATALSTSIASTLGTASTCPYLESAAGITVGGRSGLSSMIAALLFLMALFLSPLVKLVPMSAIAAVLMFVAFLMVKNIRHLRQLPALDAIAAIVTAFVIPTTLSVADGIGLGLISYTLLALVSRNRATLNRPLGILVTIFCCYFILRHITG